jgi:serine/threonine protein kinase
VDTQPEIVPAVSKSQEPNAISPESWQSRWVPREGFALKKGGQSIVQIVQSLDAKKIGALKLLNDGFDSQRRARMAREVMLLEKLRGVIGIPDVLDHNTTNFENKAAVLYVVLELIDGRSINEEFNGPVGLDRATELTIKLCQTVRACHHHGVIHRDIKLDNVLFNPQSGDLWLIDFGIGWADEDSAPLKTEFNEELGNRFLKLPELLSGISEKHDPRSDLTFVCGIFFWFLTHRKPAVLISDDLKPPHRRLLASFPKEVVSDRRWPLIESLFDVGFAPALTQRFQNADDLLRRLREILEPPPLEDTIDPIEEEHQKLLQFQQRAEVQLRTKIEMAMRDASTQLLKELTELAKKRNLHGLSTGMAHQLDANTWYIRFLLKMSPEGDIYADVCHWIRLVDPDSSYIEACFSFDLVNPAPQGSVAPYYREPAADISRLSRQVDEKAKSLFAELLTELRTKLEKRFS